MFIIDIQNKVPIFEQLKKQILEGLSRIREPRLYLFH